MITIQDIQRLKSFKVLVIGDNCTDIYKYGVIDRLCPEAPVPVFKFLHESETDGMAGNVRNNLISLGMQVDIFCNSQTIKKIRYVDEKTNYLILREDHETLPLDEIIIDTKQLKKYDAIVISDYDKGTITKNLYKLLREFFSGPIFVDSKKKDLSFFNDAIIKINEIEMSKIINRPQNSEIIVTLGGKGAMYNDIVYTVSKSQVFDVSGAGDTFMAGLVAKYMLCLDIRQSIPFANLCASLVVKKRGTSLIKLEEVCDTRGVYG